MATLPSDEEMSEIPSDNCCDVCKKKDRIHRFTLGYRINPEEWWDRFGSSPPDSPISSPTETVKQEWLDGL